ncbi:MAG: alpha-amylase family glycosyl hydrolase [Rhodoluna sp.]
MRKLALVVAVLLAILFVPKPAPSNSNSEVGVQLFMWNWSSVGKECKTHLGPAGFDWVLVMPPQNHIAASQWWAHYQPVDYRLESRLGTRKEFAQMVSDCKSAGVKVIADAVINHMVGRSSGTAWTGEPFKKYHHPGLYSDDDFHKARLPIANFGDLNQVQNFELLRLSDLATEKNDVRQKISNYLNDLLSLGVYGFRIDAARHIPVADLKAIKFAMPQNTYFLQEVAADTNPDIRDYLATGDVFEFDWPKLMKKAFGNSSGASYLPKRLKSADLIETDKAVTMVSNHDTERDGSAITTNDAFAQQLAFIFTLASDYGKPMIYSGFAFENRDESPQLLDDGSVANVICPAEDKTPNVKYSSKQFTCQHRWKSIEGMIAWRDAVGSHKETSIVGDAGLLSFGRGKLGHVIFNTRLQSAEVKIQTRMKPGQYCDLVSGGRLANSIRGKCLGETVTVDSRGVIQAILESKTAIAISERSVARW